METSGDQINKKVNVPEIGNQFIAFYFQSLNANIQKLYESSTIKPHTRLKYRNIEYKDEQLKVVLQQIGAQLNFIIEESIVMDSGARRADILVNGYIVPNNDNTKKVRFAQYFTIANNNKEWFIHNTLLSILE